MIDIFYFFKESDVSYQQHNNYGMPKNSNADGSETQIISANTIIGNDVYSQNEENLGEIKEIMLDTRSGDVCYAVLSHGGFLGWGSKLLAIPWEALRLDTNNKRFVLNIDSNALFRLLKLTRDYKYFL